MALKRVQKDGVRGSARGSKRSPITTLRNAGVHHKKHCKDFLSELLFDSFNVPFLEQG